MFSIDFSALRQQLASMVGAVVFASVLIGAAVLPAQPAAAAIFGM